MSKYLYILFAFFALLIASYPIWQAGFYSDDATLSTLPGILILQNKTLVQWIYADILDWMGQGRFAPLLMITTHGIWGIFYTLFSYRLVQWLMILLSLLAFSGLIYQITRQWKIAVFSVVVIPCCWSITAQHCVLTSFAPLYPLIALLMIGVIFFYFQYLQQEKRYNFWLSALCYFLCLLTNEVGVTLLPIILLLELIYFRGWRHAVMASLPFLFLTVIYLFLSYLTRVHGVSYNGIALGTLSPFAFTLVKQLTGALPLMYYLFNPHGYIPKLGIFTQLNLLPLAALLFTMIFFLVYKLSDIQVEGKKRWSLLVIGIFIQIIPAILIASTQKYQNSTVKFGYGYLPVYLQYFGLVILLIVFISIMYQYFFKNKNRAWQCFRIALAIVIGIGSGIGFLANNYQIVMNNMYYKYPRVLLENALKYGLLTNIPETAFLIRSSGLKAGWENKRLIVMHTGLKIDVATEDALQLFRKMHLQNKKILGMDNPNTFLLDYYVGSPTSGYVVLAKIKKVIYQTNSTGQQLILQLINPRIYYIAHSLGRGQQLLVQFNTDYTGFSREFKRLIESCQKDKPCLLSANNQETTYSVKIQ